MLALLTACASQTLDDFHEEGDAITRQLVIELKKIRAPDDLVEHTANLQVLFNQLVDVMIRAQEFKDRHPDSAYESLQPRDQHSSDQLRMELNRILHMEGGRDVLEKTQEEALNRLDTFMKTTTAVTSF